MSFIMRRLGGIGLITLAGISLVKEFSSYKYLVEYDYGYKKVVTVPNSKIYSKKYNNSLAIFC